MLDPEQIEHAVDLQDRSYRLLRWMVDAVARGLLPFDRAHDYSTLPEASEAWIRRHYRNIPTDAQVSPHNLPEFCQFFSTYLYNSFDLVANPGQLRYSPGAHCYCPICSWLVDAPNLKTKKPSPSDKRRAQRMMASAVQRVAAEQKIMMDDDEAAAIAGDPEMREPVALVAYAHDLSLRLQGVANGPAVLALWRCFAWTPEGSPRKGFALRATDILEAERQLIDAIAARQQ